MNGSRGSSSVTRRRRERGQSMTEYIIIVALIAIGAIAVVTVFGDNIRALFGTSANALAGQPQQLQTNTVTDEQVGKSLRDFGEGQEAGP